MDLDFYWKSLFLEDLGRVLTRSYFIGADDRRVPSIPASPWKEICFPGSLYFIRRVWVISNEMVFEATNYADAQITGERTIRDIDHQIAAHHQICLSDAR